MNHIFLLILPCIVLAHAVDISDDGKNNKTRRDDDNSSSDGGSSSSSSSGAIMGTPEPLSQPMPMFSPAAIAFPPPGLYGQLSPPPGPGMPPLGSPFFRPMPMHPPPPHSPHMPHMMQARMHLSPAMPFYPPAATMVPLHMVPQMKRWDEPSLFESLLNSESHMEPFGSFLQEDPIEIDEEDLLAHRRPPSPSSPAHRRESVNEHHSHHPHHPHPHHHSHSHSHSHSHHAHRPRNSYRQALHEPDRPRSDPYEPIGMENRFDRPPYESRAPYRNNDYNDEGRDSRDNFNNNVAPVHDDGADRYTGNSPHYDRHHAIDHNQSRSSPQHTNSLSPPSPTSSNGDFAEK